ncbi:MAG: LLM class flavin-dependent oxidoreductase [Thermomicrobiales bacterium]|nr:LLM class flavin-dependent oxidoreductase [Thermomicrobiales bacterium]
MGDAPVDEIVARARQAEAAGYDAFWVADERFFREPYQLLALAGAATRRIALGPCVADPFTRHPALTALAIATLDEATDGRAVLVYGAGKSGFQEMGIDRRRSATALREATLLVRTLLAEGHADVAGEIISFRDGRLNLPVPRRPPIWIASEGPRTREMAGAVADAVMIGSAAAPIEIERAAAHIRTGAERVGRPAPPIHLRLDAAIADRPEPALDAMRPIALRHLLRHAPEPGFAERHDLDAATRTALQAVDYRSYSRDADRVGQWAALVPDRLIAPFAWAGTAEQIAAAATAVAPFVAGVTVYPVPTAGQSWSEAATRLAATIGPALG